MLKNADALAGHLTVLGTLDTAGRSLTVNGWLATTGDTIAKASGLLAFRHRSGPLPPVTVSLIADAENDLADDDGDGLGNLLELLLGTDPGAGNLPTPQITLTSAGPLQLLVRLPVGPLGVRPRVEVSTNLSSWNTVPGFITITGDATAAGIRTLTVESALSVWPHFIHLRATR